MDTTSVADTAIAVDRTVIDLGLVLLGSLLTLTGYWVKAMLDRRTRTSNRIFELRLEAIDKLWGKYNRLVWVLGKSTQLGYNEWRDNHYEEAERAREEFRMEVERQQIILDKEIVEEFVKIGGEAMKFVHGNYKNENDDPISYFKWYNEKLSPKLNELSSLINESLQKRTHTVSLEFRGEET